MTPLEWMTDRNLCGATFAGQSWLFARTLVAAIMGAPMTPEMLAIYQECTGRTVAPAVAFGRAMVAAGRGAGKTLTAAFVVVYLAACRNFRTILGPGELATVMLIAPDRRQARVAMRYVRGLLTQAPMLRQLIESETKESITLATGACIEIHTSSFKTVRGYSLAGVVIDEVAFLPTDDSANPDVELVRAVTPGLARVPGSLLLAISSPYSKRGVLWQNFRRHHGIEGAPVLTWQAPTRRMNPTIEQTVVDEALADDATAARSEWLAEFRDDIASYIDADTLRAVVVEKRGDLEPSMNYRYEAFTDPAGGGGQDSFTLAIGHRDERHHGIVDKVVEIRPPFSPDSAVRELAAVLKAYGCHRVTGDRYGGLWPSDRFRQHGIRYEEATLTRSELYLEALPVITAQRCELPDHPRLLHQFAMLDRRTGTGRSRDAVDHARNQHDDLSNAVAGLLVTLAQRRSGSGTARITGV